MSIFDELKRYNSASAQSNIDVLECNDRDKVEKKVQEYLAQIEQSFDKTVKIAVIGRVSTGKSSLINALFNVKKGETQRVQVGAVSGVTTEIKEIKWSDNVTIIDSPGLSDVIRENSQETRNILNDIDVGILVVAGSVDDSQKAHYDELKQYAGKVFVVVNKIDMFDDLTPDGLEEVVEQWHKALNLSVDDKIFQTCTKGYDPKYNPNLDMDIRGVDKLRDEVLEYLKEHGKDLLLAREMMSKSELVKREVLWILGAVATASFLPGSTIYITGIQAGAIVRIHYIYTNEVLSKDSAFATIPSLIGKNVGFNLSSFFKSLPPIRILNIAEAGVAVSVTFVMLMAVNSVYEKGYNLNNESELKQQFDEIAQRLKDVKEDKLLKVAKNPTDLKALIDKFIK